MFGFKAQRLFRSAMSLDDGSVHKNQTNKILATTFLIISKTWLFLILLVIQTTVSKLVVWKANGNLLQGSVNGFKIAPPSSGRGSTSCKLPDNSVIIVLYNMVVQLFFFFFSFLSCHALMRRYGSRIPTIF